MATEADENRTGKSLSMWQATKAAFSGDASAQNKARMDMTRQNENQAALDAIRLKQQQNQGK